VLFPSVALVHFLMLNDYGRLSVIDPLNVGADGSTCMAVFHDYIDPVGNKKIGNLIYNFNIDGGILNEGYLDIG